MASKLKQIWWLMLIFAVCNLAIAYIISQSPSEDQTDDVYPIAAKSVYTIGILQSDNLPEQEKMTQGVLASLAVNGYENGKKARIEILKADGSHKKLDELSRKLAGSRKDLVIAVGTDSAQAMAKVTRKIPVVGIGVMNFKKSEAFEDHQNFTGISDNPPVLNQIRMAQRCFPVKELGYLYNPSNDVSVYQLNILREVAMKKGIRLYEVAYHPEQPAAAQIEKLVGHISALYVPEDRDLLAHFDEVVKIMNQAHIPIISEHGELVGRGAVISVSPSYYRMGFSGGQMAVRLLAGELIPADIPIVRQNDPDIVINMKQINLLQIALPGDLWQRARKLYLYDGQPARP